MKTKDILLGILVTIIWGCNFVLIKFALTGAPPLFLTCLRFTLASLPVLFIARPVGLSWGRLLSIGCTLFLGQFVFLFLAIAFGMPPGLASVVIQVQVLFTMVLAIFTLGERPDARRIFGSGLSLAGLAIIVSTAGQQGGSFDIPLVAIASCVAAALSWAVGNVLWKRAGPSAGGGTLAGVAWLSLVPPIPTLLLSLWFEGWPKIAAVFLHPGVLWIGSLLYIVIVSTWIGYGLWGYLMGRYPAGIVAPFTLLVPLFGALSAWFVLGEQFSPGRLAGSVLIVAGLGCIVLPARWFPPRKHSKSS